MNSRLSEEEAMRARHRQRVQEARRRKRRQRIFRRVMQRLVLPITGILILFLLLFLGVRHFRRQPEAVKAGTEREGNAKTEIASGNYGAPESMQAEQEGAEPQEITDRNPHTPSDTEKQDNRQEQAAYTADSTEDTLQLGGDISSSHAILVDVGSGSILAQKDAKSIVSPASMTKILTVLVAAEHVENLEDTFTITRDITDYSYVNDCSNVGFAENETVTVRDLLYGTILPSGADAAAGLAAYVAGSREAFVDLMNEKLKELGLSDTAHVTNCVGIYDTSHYCTVYDMAMILEAAVNNELCKQVLSAHTYTTSETEQHPEGITISNWFLRRIEDKDTGPEMVVCGKTGYVVQSGNCAASYAEDGDGKGYICVTADAANVWKCIYDHVALYKQFAPKTEQLSAGSSDNSRNG